MKEHPIMFSTEMVKAILEGRKTQTRRVIKSAGGHHYSHPYYKVGDVLWVKETWKITRWNSEGYRFGIGYKTPGGKWDVELSEDNDRTEQYWIECSDDCHKAGLEVDIEGCFIFPEGREVPTRWRSPLFMPRAASRISLRIVKIKIKRLQEITYEDEKAEGIQTYPVYDSNAYKNLWNKINGKKYPWESNPWVWVIEFEVME